MLPTVSIGIATYNRREVTRRAVASVLAQDYPGAIEVCVYDDGSDEPPAIIAGDVGPCRRVLVERGGRNLGIAVAKNAALRMGTGDLRGILDSDDEYLPGFVSRCVKELHAADVVYTDDQDERGGVITPTPAADWNDGNALLTCRLRGDTWLARWAALERSGLHDERFELEVDYALFYALWQIGASFRRIPETLVTIHRLDETATKDRAKAAYWHAAGLGRYGHSIEWALRRAVGHPEWEGAIRDGYRFGKSLR